MATEPLPVTGAWHRAIRPATASSSRSPPTGRSRSTAAPCCATSGRLRDVGPLNADASNAVLVCHAWTGDSHAAGPAGRGHTAPGWWDDMIGPGPPIDTDHYFVVCANVLGGCQGSTGPASPHPDDGRPYGSRFPVVTIRDMVRAPGAVHADHLGIDRWPRVIGGSMGGMQVLEWAITYPDRVRSIVPIATCMQATAQQIAWGAIGRRAIHLDPAGGAATTTTPNPATARAEGLSIARMVAQVTFRSDNVFTERFGREPRRPGRDRRHVRPVAASSRSSATSITTATSSCGRFDANSYLIIGKAMDLHDVARGRGGLEAAMARIRIPNLTMGISSDFLYPPYQQQSVTSGAAGRSGRACRWRCRSSGSAPGSAPSPPPARRGRGRRRGGPSPCR